jgi:hypothetical protein
MYLGVMGGLWDQWRGELKALFAVGAITAVIMAVGYFRYWGPVTVETGEVIRFGSYASDLGNLPIAIVRTGDGRITELRATPILLRYCSRGSRIRLIRRKFSLSIDPRGCR